MCTVSIIPLVDGSAVSRRNRVQATGCRIVCNRDESRLRPPATPPVVRQLGDRLAALPIDPLSDGTWIGFNDAGIAVTLLNATCADGAALVENRTCTPPSLKTSRGTIVPDLLAADSCDQAVQRALRLKVGQFEPFRLLIISAHGCIELASDGRSIRYSGAIPTAIPSLFSSSGLGDQLVQRPRQALFESLMASAQVSSDLQDRFHDHHWPDRPHLSVRMARPDARTVSRTIIELHPDRGLMRHQSLSDQGEVLDEIQRSLHFECPSVPRREHSMGVDP